MPNIIGIIKIFFCFFFITMETMIRINPTSDAIKTTTAIIIRKYIRYRKTNFRHPFYVIPSQPS